MILSVNLLCPIRIWWMQSQPAGVQVFFQPGERVSVGVASEEGVEAAEGGVEAGAGEDGGVGGGETQAARRHVAAPRTGGRRVLGHG